jgi:hypothetical protein
MTKRQEQIKTNNDTQKLKIDQHESHKKSGINSGDPEGFSVEGNNCFIIQKLL